MHSHAHPRPDTGSWLDDAACRGADTRLFFPTKGNQSQWQVEAAKRICAECPVVEPCLDEAMGPPLEPYGIRGGLTFDERRDLRRRKQYAQKRGMA